MKPGDRVKHKDASKNIYGIYKGQAVYYSHTSIDANVVIDIIRGTKAKLDMVEKITQYQNLNKLIAVSLLDLDDRAGLTAIDTEDFLAKYVAAPIYQPDLFEGINTERTPK